MYYSIKTIKIRLPFAKVGGENTRIHTQYDSVWERRKQALDLDLDFYSCLILLTFALSVLQVYVHRVDWV